MLQTLRRRIDVLSKQKSDIKASLTAAKSSCESKSGDNESLRSQIKVRNLCNEDSWDHHAHVPVSTSIVCHWSAVVWSLRSIAARLVLATCPCKFDNLSKTCRNAFLLSPDVPDLRFLV